MTVKKYTSNAGSQKARAADIGVTDDPNATTYAVEMVIDLGRLDPTAGIDGGLHTFARTTLPLALGLTNQAGANSGGGGGPGPDPGDPLNDVDLIIFTGQSANTRGGTPEAADQFPSGVSMGNYAGAGGANSALVPAAFPMVAADGDSVNANTYIPSFIQHYAANHLAAGRQLAFINAGKGNTGLSTGDATNGGWGTPANNAFNQLHEQVITRANAVIASMTGTPRVIIVWSGGRADANQAPPMTRAAYATQLSAAVNDWRTRITAADATTPFIIMSMNPYGRVTDNIGGAQLDIVDAQRIDVPTQLAHMAYVETWRADGKEVRRDGNPNVDPIHLDLRANRVAGQHVSTEGYPLAVAKTSVGLNPTPTAPTIDIENTALGLFIGVRHSSNMYRPYSHALEAAYREVGAPSWTTLPNLFEISSFQIPLRSNNPVEFRARWGTGPYTESGSITPNSLALATLNYSGFELYQDPNPSGFTLTNYGIGGPLVSGSVAATSRRWPRQGQWSLPSIFSSLDNNGELNSGYTVPASAANALRVRFSAMCMFMIDNFDGRAHALVSTEGTADPRFLMSVREPSGAGGGAGNANIQSGINALCVGANDSTTTLADIATRTDYTINTAHMGILTYDGTIGASGEWGLSSDGSAFVNAANSDPQPLDPDELIIQWRRSSSNTTAQLEGESCNHMFWNDRILNDADAAELFAAHRSLRGIRANGVG